MLLSGSASRPATVSGYRFAGVLVDVSRARVLVDDVEVAAGALPLKLLRVLCESDGVLLTRQTLFDQIWPRQDVSDEALSKLVGRTRELLGPYGDTLITVRGQGVRLDARITQQLDFAAPSVTAPNVSAKVAPPGESAAPVVEPYAALGDPAPPSAWWRTAMAAVGVIVMITLAVVLWQPPTDVMVYPGYALRASDLQANKPETAALLSAAFQAVSKGELLHARTMMRSVHDSDPTTPVPAMMLAYWDEEKSKQWIADARARLRPDSPAYLRLLVDYFVARSSNGDVRGPINALLDLRPQAWVLQFARAHDQMANREFAGSLASLKQISLDGPDADQVADALADRVSLGDATAVELVPTSISKDSMLNGYLQGRFAYSRGDLTEAIAHFDRSREAAQVRRDYIHMSDAAMFAAMAAMEARTADAIQRVDGAARLCHEQNLQTCEAEMLSLRAYLEARSGQPVAATETIKEAWQRVRWDWSRPPIVFIALENGLTSPADPAAVASLMPGDAVFGGVADLLLAWQEFARGNQHAAQGLLKRARDHGIAQTWHAEDAALLGARLGETPAPCRVDPPFPNHARLSACVTLQSMQRH